jgi:hypothetical protein
MPVDSEVAKERIWKEHCEKMVMQSIRFQQEGKSHAEFTMNPYHLHHNKPVTDPVSVRSKDFLDRPKATLQALSARLAASGLDPTSGSHADTFAESSPRNVARQNKTRAAKGNNIFGTGGASAESKRKLFEEWSEVLNHEIGGGKCFRDSGSFLPPINSRQSSPYQNSPMKGSGAAPSPMSPNKILASPTSTEGNALNASTTPQGSRTTGRDEVVQELLLRSAKPPTMKYTQPQTESQVLGWEAQQAPKPNPMFTFLHKSCDMTRFAAESGHSPTSKKGQ